MLATLTLLPGWTTISQATYGAQISEIQSQLAGGPATRTLQAELGLLWTLPADVSDSRGLGGGVTWAIDPALCGPLLPNFREDVAFINFITCEDVRASVARAFNQWSANNKWVNFQEVTSECDALGASWGQPTQYGHAGCSIAEIWVTSITSAGRRLQGGPNLTFTELELNGALPVATATPHIRATPDFRHTSGQVPFFAASPGGPRDFVETYGGTFAINVEPDVCWYLDSSFCSGFHSLKAALGNANDARVLVQALLLGVMGVALVLLFVMNVDVIRACFGDVKAGKRPADIDGDGKLSCRERWFAALEELADWNPLGLALLVTLIISPPLLWFKIMEPCWDCFDFEAAALHEIGHFLGLGHPDNIPDNQATAPVFTVSGPGQNSYNADLAAGIPFNSTTCERTWASVMPGAPPGSTGGVTDELQEGNYPVREAIMEAFTQNNPKACLFADDVEALATLYPDCDALAAQLPVCHKVRHNIGLLRVMLYILVPLLIALFLILIFSGCMHRYQQRQTSKAREELSEAKAELTVSRWKAAVALARRPSSGFFRRNGKKKSQDELELSKGTSSGFFFFGKKRSVSSLRPDPSSAGPSARVAADAAPESGAYPSVTAESRGGQEVAGSRLSLLREQQSVV